MSHQPTATLLNLPAELSQALALQRAQPQGLVQLPGQTRRTRMWSM